MRVAGKNIERGVIVRWSLLLVVVGALLLGACSPIGYYARSAWGGASILVKRKPIERVLERDDLDPARRAALERVPAMVDFAHDELGLPDNGSYRSYVDLERRFVSWTVVAAPRYSIQPRVWCFPIAGCVSYRGYFSEKRARRYAEKLEKEEGDDTSVGGVEAYSTLGWFADPIFSTFLDRPSWSLAGLIFHELAHQRVYLPGDTAFNESFATAVERLGVERWARINGSSADVAAMEIAFERESQFVGLVLDHRECLTELYESEEDEAALASGKVELFEEMKVAYRDLSRGWIDGPRYDGWFERDLNNAHIAGIGDYNLWTPAFLDMAEQAGSLESFYEEVAELADLEVEERTRRLEQLTGGDGVTGPRCPSSVGEEGQPDGSATSGEGVN